MRAPLFKFLSVICLFALGGLHLHAAAPRNDAQSEAFRIFDACYIVGDNSEATHEVGELDHALAGGSKSLWWELLPSFYGENTLTVRPYGNDSDFVLSVYRESYFGEPVQVIAQINSQVDSAQHYTTQFGADPGARYYIAVDSPSGSAGGRFYLGLNQAPAFLTPLQVRVPLGEAFEIPVNIAGAPSEVLLLNGPESVAYDATSKMLRGTLPNYSNYDAVPVTLRAANNYGDRYVDIVLVPEREEWTYTGTASAVGFVGVPFEYVLSFDGDPQLTSQDIQAAQLPQGFYLVKESGQWKIKGLADKSHDTVMRIDIQIPEGKDLFLEIPLLIVELADAQLQPAIISPLMIRGVVGQPFSYQVEMSLPIVNHFGAGPLPAGLTLDQESGLISGTPEHYGAEVIQLTADLDYPPHFTKADLIVQISAEAEFAPVIQSSPTAVAWVGVPFEYQIEATNGVDHYDAHGLPQGLTLNQDTGLISGIPEWVKEGEQLWITVQNQRGSTEFIVMLDILGPDRIAHVTSSAQVSATVGEFFEYQIETNLEVYDSYELFVHHLPEGLEYDEANARIFGVPQLVGNENMEIQFFNNIIFVQLRVVENEKPVEFLNAATVVGRVGSFFYFSMNAKGADHFSASPLVPGLAFSSQTGVFTGVPTAAGTYRLRVYGYSERGELTHTELKIVILEETEVVPPPMILSPGQLLVEVGETFAYSISSSESGNQNFDAWNLPDGVIFDQASGTIFGSVDQPHKAVVRIFTGAADAYLHLHFYESAERPLLVTSAPSAVGRVGELFEYQIETNATEMDAQDLYFYTGVNFPDSLSVDDHTGLIYGYLEGELPADFEVHVDVPGDFSELRFTIVDGGTGVPAQVVSPAHIVAYPDEPFEYQFVFDQADVSFDIPHLEEGVSYDASTHTLSGSRPFWGDLGIDFERYDESSSRWFQGQIYLEVRNPHFRPIPLMISDAGPVANQGEFFRYDVEFDQSGVEWSVDHAPEWLSQSGDQLVGYVPEDGNYDQEEVNLTYYGTQGEWHHVQLTLNYNAPQHPVVIVSPASAHATVGAEFSYQLEVEGAYDEIGLDLPEWASYDLVLMRVTGVPDAPGVEIFNVGVSRDGSSIDAQVQVVVEDAWQLPVITSLQPSPVFEGVPYQYQIEVDGVFDSVNYNGPSELTLDVETLLLSGILDHSGGSGLSLYLQNPIEGTEAHVDLFGDPRIAPFLLEELQDLVIYPGGKAYFRPNLAAEFANYEWFKDEVSLGGGGDWFEIDAVSIDDQGNYSVRIANEYAEVWTLPVALQVGQSSAYRDWLIAHIGREIDEPHYTESDSSFAGDTTPDLMKWAFGVDPTTVVSSPLAESSLESEGFQIQFQRSAAPRDIQIVVERSGTLDSDEWSAIAILPPEGSWQALQPDVTVDETGTGALRSVTVIDSGEFTQYFLRVRIELVAED